MHERCPSVFDLQDGRSGSESQCLVKERRGFFVLAGMGPVQGQLAQGIGYEQPVLMGSFFKVSRGLRVVGRVVMQVEKGVIGGISLCLAIGQTVSRRK